MSNTKRYTLPLPEALYNEISALAEKHNKSMKEVLQQCLRFGLTAMKIDEDPNSEILFRERVPDIAADGSSSVRESIVRFVW